MLLKTFNIDLLGWKLDFTASQMIVTLKLIAFAFDISDKKQKVPFPSQHPFFLLKNNIDIILA